MNARKQANIKYSPNESFYLELDVWFPKRKICFEFQVCLREGRKKGREEEQR